MAKRRWALKVRDLQGEETFMVVEVPRGRKGLIFAKVRDQSIVFSPAELGRFRTALADAQAVALQDRGDW